jgi:hypothetical protein
MVKPGEIEKVVEAIIKVSFIPFWSPWIYYVVTTVALPHVRN